MFLGVSQVGLCQNHDDKLFEGFYIALMGRKSNMVFVMTFKDHHLHVGPLSHWPYYWVLGPTVYLLVTSNCMMHSVR